MLVDIAEQVETPKKVALNGCLIPGIVWLKRFDYCDCVFGHSGGELVESLPSLGIIGVENGELGVLRNLRRETSQTPNQLIQRGTEAIAHISSNHSEPRGHVGTFGPDTAEAMFNVIFNSKGCGLRFLECTQFTPKAFKMFLRPGGFEAGIGKSGFSAHRVAL
jgi:hypothetical protein